MGFMMLGPRRLSPPTCVRPGLPTYATGVMPWHTWHTPRCEIEPTRARSKCRAKRHGGCCTGRMMKKPYLVLFQGLLLLGAAGGCNRTSDDTSPDSGSDAGLPDSGSDAGCSERGVWTTASSTFTLTSSGGFVAPPPPDAGCTMTGTTYQFSATVRTVSQHGCTFEGATDHLVNLNQSGVDSVIAAVSSLRTTCHQGCGADAPERSLTIGAAGVETVYASDFYAACSGTVAKPPLIAFGDLGTLATRLDALITAACNPTDAGAANPGTCSH